MFAVNQYAGSAALGFSGVQSSISKQLVGNTGAARRGKPVHLYWYARGHSRAKVCVFKK